jgi:hypothetical protein
VHRNALDEAVELARYAVGLNQRYGHRNELPWVAIALAGAVVRQGRVKDAAVLVASAEATAQRLGLREPDGDVADNDRIRALIAERAGADLGRWHASGRTLLPLDDALRVALGDRPEVGVGHRTAQRSSEQRTGLPCHPQSACTTSTATRAGSPNRQQLRASRWSAAALTLLVRGDRVGQGIRPGRL